MEDQVTITSSSHIGMEDSNSVTDLLKLAYSEKTIHDDPLFFCESDTITDLRMALQLYKTDFIDSSIIDRRRPKLLKNTPFSVKDTNCVNIFGIVIKGVSIIIDGYTEFGKLYWRPIDQKYGKAEILNIRDILVHINKLYTKETNDLLINNISKIVQLHRNLIEEESLSEYYEISAPSLNGLSSISIKVINRKTRSYYSVNILLEKISLWKDKKSCLIDKADNGDVVIDELLLELLRC